MNNTVLITGSSRGIGMECAIYLAQKGYDIVLHCNSNYDRALLVKEEIEKSGKKARILQFDVSNYEQTREILTKDINENGIYWGIVLNAGICKDNPLPVMEKTDWDDVINTNLGGFYNVLHPIILPLIQKREGRIVAISSVSGQTGNRGQVNYSASKAGIIGAVKALSRETAKRNITVNCVAPGIIKTEMTQNIDENIIKELVPMKRAGEAREVAYAVAFLLDREASYITGQVISINGGMYL